MEHFRNMTIRSGLPKDICDQYKPTPNAVIMGRKTYESLPKEKKYLPKRTNYVLSSSQSHPYVYFMDSIESCLKHACSTSFRDVLGMPITPITPITSSTSCFRDIWIIGGESVYRQFLEQTQYPVYDLWVTRLYEDFECDRFMPPFEDSYKRVFTYMTSSKMHNPILPVDFTLYSPCSFERWIPNDSVDVPNFIPPSHFP